LERELTALSTADLMTAGGLGDQAVLHWLLAEADPALRHGRLYAHPRLFVPGVIEALRPSPTAPEPEVTAVLDYAAGQRSSAERDPGHMPIGAGPIELLWSALGTSQASQSQVLARAATPVIASTMSVPYMMRLAELAWSAAERGTSGLTLARLLLAAATGEQPGIGDTLRWRAAVAFIDVVHRVLTANPDGPLLAEATRLGEQELPLAQRDGGGAAAVVQFALGTMFLDPYTAEKETWAYPQRIAEWLRLEARRGPGEPSMPPAADALRSAVRWLRESASTVTGRERGFARKALAQALVYQGALGETVDRDQIVDLLQGALQDLDPDRDTHDIVMTRAMLRDLTDSAGSDTAMETSPAGASASDSSALTCSLDELEQRHGPIQAAEMVRAEIGRLQSFDAPGALALAREAAPLFRRAGEEPRLLGLREEIRLLALAHNVSSSDGSGLQSYAKQIMTRAERENWDAARRGASLIILAADSGSTDEEETGLRLLQQARQLAPILAENHVEALEYLRATLLIGAGVNAFNSRDGQTANANYSAAISAVLQLGLDSMALELLQRVRDVVSRGTSAADIALATQIAPEASQLEARIGSRATDELQHAYKASLSTMAGHQTHADTVLALLQLAKGRRFAAAISNGTRYRADRDEEGTKLLSIIAHARQSVASATATNADIAPSDVDRTGEMLAEEVLVATYADVGVSNDPVSAAAAGSAGSALAHLAALERSYDARLSEQLLLGIGADAPTFTLRELQGALDARTVLLEFYVGLGPAGGGSFLARGDTRGNANGRHPAGLS
jgi:hypothetical protein